MISEVSRPLEIKKFVVGGLSTNCYVVHDKNSLEGILIDPGEYDPGISEYIRDNNINIKFTLNTHCHADHVLADAAFGFPVMIHELDEDCLRDPEKNLSFMAGQDIEPLEVGRLLSDGDMISFGNISMEVIHTPGHTPGSISVKCGDVIFSGDTLFFEGIGRTDLVNGDHNAIIRSIKEKLLVFPDDIRVLPGHGMETTIGHERQFFGDV